MSIEMMVFSPKRIDGLNHKDMLQFDYEHDIIFDEHDISEDVDSMMDYCGLSNEYFRELRQKARIHGAEYLKKNPLDERYYPWDTDMDHPVNAHMDMIGYWSNAEFASQWFSERCNDEREDYCFSMELTPELLKEFIACCDTVLKNSKLVNGKVYRGTEFRRDPINGKAERNIQVSDGKVIEDCSAARASLPLSCESVYGYSLYDEDYLRTLKDLRNRMKDWIRNYNPAEDMLILDVR